MTEYMDLLAAAAAVGISGLALKRARTADALARQVAATPPPPPPPMPPAEQLVQIGGRVIRVRNR